MTQNETWYALLTDAVEDCTPLWDAVWEVAGVSSDDPDSRFLACIAEAQRLVRELLLHGLINISHGRGWPPSANHEVEVTREKAEAILATPTNWHLPANDADPYFCFHATEDGKALWLRGKSEFSL